MEANEKRVAIQREREKEEDGWLLTGGTSPADSLKYRKLPINGSHKNAKSEPTKTTSHEAHECKVQFKLVKTT